MHCTSKYETAWDQAHQRCNHTHQHRTCWAGTQMNKCAYSSQVYQAHAKICSQNRIHITMHVSHSSNQVKWSGLSCISCKSRGKNVYREWNANQLVVLQATEYIQMISACSKVCKIAISSIVPCFIHMLRFHSSEDKTETLMIRQQEPKLYFTK